MAVTVLSGIAGLVAKGASAVTQCRKWSIGVNTETQPYASSATKKGHGRVVGNADWKGSYNTYGFLPAVMPGDSFVFHGSLDGVKGVNGTALCESVEIVWDIENGKIIEHTVEFAANGVLTEGAETGVADTTVPNPPTAVGCVIKITPLGGVEATIDEVRTMRLKITRASQAFVGSAVAGQKRRVATNWDFEVSYTCYQNDLSALPQPNSIAQLKLYCTDPGASTPLWWDLKWVMFKETSGVDVDIEGGTLVGATVTGDMNGFAVVTGTPTTGFIKTPEATPTTIWP